MKDFLISKFPMIQGTRNQLNFKELGEGSSWKNMAEVVKKLQEKKEQGK